MTLHRISGYLVFFSNLILTTTGLLFSPLGLSYTHADRFHLHRPFGDVKGLSWIAWPTFEVSLWVIGPLQLSTAVLLVRAARRHDIAAHQRYATLHTIFGLVIHLQRANMVAVQVFAAILEHVVPDATQRSLGVPTDKREFWKGEMASFALTVSRLPSLCSFLRLMRVAQAWAAFAIAFPSAWQVATSGRSKKSVSNGSANGKVANGKAVKAE